MKNLPIIAASLFLLVGAGLIWQRDFQSTEVLLQAQPVEIIGNAESTDSVPASDSVGSKEGGAFVSTYIPKGWEVVQDELYSWRVESPDYVLGEPPSPDVCEPESDGFISEACVMNASQLVMTKGAFFDISFYPCLYGGETEANFRQRWASEYSLSEQTPITLEGHDAVLFHWGNNYKFFVIVSPTDCQDVQFGFIPSATTDYSSEFQKFIAGMKFVPGRSAR